MRALVVISEVPPIITAISRVPQQMQRYFPDYGIEMETFSYRDVGLINYH